MDTFGKRLLYLIKKNKFTQVEVSQHLKVDKSLITKYIAGDHIPRGDKVGKLAGLLNTTTDYLLLGIEPTSPDISEIKRIVDKAAENAPEQKNNDTDVQELKEMKKKEPKYFSNVWRFTKEMLKKNPDIKKIESIIDELPIEYRIEINEQLDASIKKDVKKMVSNGKTKLA